MRLALLLLFTLFPFGLNAQNALKFADQLILQKEYAKAEQELLRALDSSSDPELKDRLGEVYGYQTKWDKAIDIYSYLTKTYPDKANYFFRYGGVLAKKAQKSNKLMALTLIGRIKRNLKKSVELDPKHIKAYWALIDLYVSLPGIVGGSNDRAEEYAYQLEAISEIDGYLARGYIFEYDEKPVKAKEMYLKALDLFDEVHIEDRNQLHYQIGKVCGDYGAKLELGIDHMYKYINNYTVLDGVPLEWAYFRMAKLYRKAGDKNYALKWVDKALATKKDFKPALEEKKKILLLKT